MSQPINDLAGTKRHAIFSQWATAMSEAKDSPNRDVQWAKAMSEVNDPLNGDAQTTTNQGYEPEDVIPLGSELDQEID